MLLRKLCELRKKIISNFLGIFSKFFFFDRFQNTQPYSTLDVSSTKRIEVDLLDFIENTLSGNNCPHGETITNAFRHSNDIRCDALPFMPPILRSNSSESSLNLVADNQSSVFVSHNINQFWKIAVRKRIDSSSSLNALKDAAWHFAICNWV